MSESWRIVTSDVGFHTPSTRTTKIVSLVSSGPVKTAPQDDKTMQELKQTLDHKSEEVPLAIGRGCGDRDFSSEEENDQNRTVFPESRGNFFLEKRYDSLHRGEIPVNPTGISENLAQNPDATDCWISFFSKYLGLVRKLLGLTGSIPQLDQAQVKVDINL
ncbi:hypothetical protein HID58_041325 [Brassica napus]|uniref:Uncharacterized protein n=1 Tax=Brassica napus TaxID=3708 RepID=A0ABQ8BBI6_BRANA|nr:hypothetical protein HID58_041325 [Brassica napus]